jgi:hypothetical protein
LALMGRFEESDVYLAKAVEVSREAGSKYALALAHAMTGDGERDCLRQRRRRRRMQMPILYVSSGPWYTDVGRFKELCPQLVTGQTVGGGHYFPLEIPEQVNLMLERFLKVNGL